MSTESEEESLNKNQSIASKCQKTNFKDKNFCELTNSIKTINKEPFQCFVDKNSNKTFCEVKYNQNTLDLIYETFSEKTGLNFDDISVLDFNQIQKTLINHNSLYNFLTMFFVISFLILFLMIFSAINLYISLFLIIFFFLIIYNSSVFYRLNSQSYIDSKNQEYKTNLNKVKQSFKDSIAYIPSALTTVSCILSGDKWKCS